MVEARERLENERREWAEEVALAKVTLQSKQDSLDAATNLHRATQREVANEAEEHVRVRKLLEEAKKENESLRAALEAQTQQGIELGQKAMGDVLAAEKRHEEAEEARQGPEELDLVDERIELLHLRCAP